ncbi:MAG: FTR1 family protein [Myxococcaceae bacterium]|nr:FTR1 family protein [Myxococcaceae bacterium]
MRARAARSPAARSAESPGPSRAFDFATHYQIKEDTIVLHAVTLLALVAAPTEWARLAGLLQYLEGDYPAALASQDEGELTEQAGFADEALTAAQGLGDAAAPILPRLEAVVARVKTRDADAHAVSKECGALAKEVFQLGNVVQAPRRPPDLELGKKVWAQSCAVCHGTDGRADTDLSKTLRPPPADFHDAERMKTLTPYKAFSTTAFGLKGTAMAPFPQLSDDERWAVAFLVFSFRQSDCTGEPPRATLEQLATSTDGDLAKVFGAEAVPCLRKKPPPLDAAAQLYAARDAVERAIGMHAAGKIDDARKAIVDGYLEGLEPIEPTLRARDAVRVQEIERAFTRTRLAAGSGQFEAEARALLKVLDTTAAGSHVSGFWSVFVAALLILLREGFEALVVVGCLLAVLKKMGATEHARTVHLGWVSALVAGGLAFVLGHQVLAAADREWLETVVGFFAVAMLLYAALWLNARANMSRFMGELREKMTGALGGGSKAGLFVIAFTAVGRESFETALFLEGLAGDSPQGVMWGAAAGLALVGVLVLFVSRVGFKLPMKTLFNASTVMLIATAVVLLGKAMHGLQELGVLPLLPVPFVELSALGLYPDGFTLLPQALVAVAPLVWLKARAATAQ